jgi:hypothetical protein
MLLIYVEEKALTEVHREKCYAESTQLCLDLPARGRFVSATPLQPADHFNQRARVQRQTLDHRWSSC